MKRIQGVHENTIVVQKSKFIAQAFRVNTTEEVEEILLKVRKKYYDATHNCYAYRIGENAQIQKMSDDGEPSKTAGAPIMDVLIKKNVTNILIIVTRYFGGILLGAGGLVRAYSTATSSVLEGLTYFEVEKQMRFIITISYSSYQTLLHMMPYIKIEKASFMTEVTLEAYCKIELYPQIVKDALNYKIEDMQIQELGIFPTEIDISNV